MIPPHELAFDIDGVFAETFRVFITTAQEEYGVQIAYEDMREYEFWHDLGLDEGMCEGIIQRILDFPVEMDIRPLQGAVRVLSALLNLGPLVFVTARPGKKAILEWIKQHLGLRDTRSIRLEATGTHREKIPVLIKRGIHYFVEDRLETCFLLEETPITPIVFEQPWNRKPHPFQRVRSWDELSTLIRWHTPPAGGL